MTPSETAVGSGTAEDAAARLIDCVSDLVGELQPGRVAVAVALDSVLDRDLAIDSLSRVELFGRLEREFGIALPEAVLATAETPRDLLRAVLGAESAVAAASAPVAVPTGEERLVLPHDARTLTQVLDHHAAAHPDRLHVRFFADDGEGEALTYSDLREGARRVAAGLSAAGLAPGEPVAIMLPTGREYFFIFFGVLIAGGVPAPLYPPGRPAQLETHLRRHAAIIANSGARFLIGVTETRRFARLLKALVATLHTVVTVEDLAVESAGLAPPALGPGDTAFLQYTSGSTGNPKGVVLSHANLLANIRIMGEALEAGPQDVCVSWLPLYHDMGLIGSWLGSLYHAAPLVIMSPLAFLARPERWLWAIHRHRGTVSGGPNFAYELCLRRLDPERLAGLDLSSWRCAFNGAEAISPRTLEAFCRRFARFGFDRRAMMPLYGLAESSVGLTFPPLGRGPVIDTVDRAAFTERGRAVPEAPGDEWALGFVCCGRPLRGHQIRIVDATGHELPERREGRLQFGGPSATSGYFRNAAETARLFDGDWLESGDLAYMAAGEVYITGRTKDVVIRGGRNIYPSEVEEAVAEVEGIQKGNVAVFGSPDPETGTERLVVLAETRKSEAADQEALRGEITALVTDLTGTPPDDVALAPLRTVPKTSSGKIRRAASREIYERGHIGAPARALWWQVLRVAVAGALPGLRRLGAAAADGLFAGYVLILADMLVVPLWLGVVVLPAGTWRWRVARLIGRLLATAAGVPLAVRGLDNLPPVGQACILVSNHMSYLDGLLLATVIPRELRFIAKVELRDSWVIRLPLDRLGVAYVERFDHRQGVDDAGRIGASAADGPAPLFFAEGTFTRAAGLLPFQMGAFIAAATAGVPVVPVAIRGTRAILREDSWFARRGAVAVTVGAPVSPEGMAEEGAGDPWAVAVRLRDAARAEILRHCGEPDLVGEWPEIFAGGKMSA